MQDVEWMPIGPWSGTPIARGDLVSVEAGGFPIYQVLDVEDGAARVRDAQGQRDLVMAIDCLRWKLLRRSAA
jgi:hypothetical protein